MANYRICPICSEPIKAKKYREHLKTHGKRKTSSANLAKLKRILNSAKKAFEKKKGNALFLSFEMARRAFSEVEKVDTSSWDYVFDYQVPNVLSKARTTVPTAYPPTMCHLRYEVKDKQLFEEFCRKNPESREEAIIKEMMLHNKPIIVVYRKNWANLVLQWKSEGMSSTDVEMLTVYFFLHEMYHILGFGEKDATIKACIIMSEIFAHPIGIPEHEIKRWEYEEKLKKRKK
jgi:DNA polymerase III delta prime subunit